MSAAPSTVHDAIVASIRPPPELSPRAASFFALGARYAPPFVAFVHAVLEDALAERHPRLHYLTREGVFFKAIHDTIARHNPFAADVPDSGLLEVSRLSTFAPSLREVAAPELMRLWNQYTTQSIGALFRSLDLDLRDYRAHLHRHAIDPDDELDPPWESAAVQALLADPELAAQARRAIEQKRARLLRYLADRGIGESVERCAIVDVGWRGSIQDNLAHLLPSMRIDGYYLALHEYLNVQPPNTRKMGVYLDLNRGHSPLRRLFDHESVIEMCCNSRTGSVLRYEPDGAAMRAVVANEPAEDRAWTEAVRHFQRGVLATVPGLCEHLRSRAIRGDGLRALALERLAALLTDPPRALTAVYFSLAHNESFGVGRFIEKRARLPLDHAVRAIWSRRARRRFRDALEATGWPQGALRHIGAEDLLRAWNAGRAVDGGAAPWIAAALRVAVATAARRSRHRRALGSED